MKRILSMVLALLLLANLVPVHAHAAETASTGSSSGTYATHSRPVCGSYCRCASDNHTSSTMILDYSYTSRLCLYGYSFTVRGLTEDGKSYTTTYNTTGWSHTHE